MRNTEWPDGFLKNAHEQVLLQCRGPDEPWQTCCMDGTCVSGIDWRHKFMAQHVLTRVERACDNIGSWEFRVLRYSRSGHGRRAH